MFGLCWAFWGGMMGLYWASWGATLHSVYSTETFGLYSLTCYSTTHYLEYCICFPICSNLCPVPPGYVEVQGSTEGEESQLLAKFQSWQGAIHIRVSLESHPERWVQRGRACLARQRVCFHSEFPFTRSVVDRVWLCRWFLQGV